MKEIVSCQDLSKKYGSNSVLNSVTFSVDEGELFFLLGPSGCGKTTLLRIIAGLDRQDYGLLKIAQQDVAKVAPEHRGVGMVFQNYSLWPHLNVRQHLEFGLKNQKLSASEIELRTQKVLELLQIADLTARFPHELSGGQQQRVSLARAIAPEPKLLLLDEPLSNLDPKLREEMRRELKALQRELGITFIYVTHDRNEAMAMGDRVAILNQGKVEQIGKPLDLYFNPKNSFVAQFLGETNILTGQYCRSENNEIGMHSELGFIALGKNATVEINDQDVLLSIRPEDISINARDSSSSGPSIISGTISEVVALGATAQIKVRLINQREILCSLSIRESLTLKEGQKVSLRTDWDKICILEK